MEPVIITKSGYFDFTAPDGYPFEIEVIGRALSKLCRFTGHTERFYSVAQHSVYVAHLMPKVKSVALAALLHDAAEAFVGDVSAPLKCLLPEYKVIERRVEQAIFKHFGLMYPMDERIKQADLTLLATEQRDLIPKLCNDTVRWHWMEDGSIEPLDYHIQPYSPDDAYRLFMAKYWNIVKDYPE